MSKSMTRSQVAKLIGMNAESIRFYEEQHKLISPIRVNGNRMYGESEVRILQKVMLYRELGLSLEEVKEILDAEPAEKKEIFTERANTLGQRSDYLRALQGLMRQMIDEQKCLSEESLIALDLFSARYEEAYRNGADTAFLEKDFLKLYREELQEIPVDDCIRFLQGDPEHPRRSKEVLEKIKTIL